MGGGCDFSFEEKTKMWCWLNENVKTTEIARCLGSHAGAVRKQLAALRKLSPEMPPSATKTRPRRTSKLSNVTLTRLKQHVLQFPFKTARQLKNDLPGLSELSVRRIQEIIHKELKIPSRVAAKKPLMTDKMIKKRLAYCRKHRSWTASDWRKVMFSDESTFRIINSRGARVRRQSSISRYRHRYTIATVKHSASVMVWGYFSGKVGRGGLYFLPKNTTMNGVR
jgi:Transposase